MKSVTLTYSGSSANVQQVEGTQVIHTIKEVDHEVIERIRQLEDIISALQMPQDVQAPVYIMQEPTHTIETKEIKELILDPVVIEMITSLDKKLGAISPRLDALESVETVQADLSIVFKELSLISEAHTEFTHMSFVARIKWLLLGVK